MSASINLRIDDSKRSLIDRAAAIVGTNRTAFILNNAMKAAQDVILDQTLFQISDEKWNDFWVALDAPPAKDFVKFMSKQNPWEK